MKLLRWIAALLVASLMATAAHAAPVTVFAAASLKNALDEVGVEYEKAGGEARFSYAASSAIARQIEQGAPADVYVSADSDWMNYLAERKLIVAASRRDLLTNRLALIAPADSKVALKVGKGMPLAKALGSGRLAVAGPDVPAGKYARASLTALGAWDSVSGKLVQAENVRAALQFVARGETPLGIVYDTDAKVEPKVRIVGLFPDGSHPKIVYPAALVASSKNPDAAKFLAFMRTPKAAAVFRKYGFVVLR
ncbi:MULTISPECIES: molybdate ABC transporter substrate-binding protein [unclassified Phenylobacterium]|uniref:molybdate ABC transporter substrate-binding protein n=1 Tax=unclassified Phenylobacterium TaxID=2640670 RepID=UPI0022B58D48|nr:molybdate ABC transporter substrate-binding protein [Phenylobacterium sp. NIBR 498073]WGU41951.1 molybdate ABC transporter substrate-binding protein [Phenylobacterium sp. NIBR 498073]